VLQQQRAALVRSVNELSLGAASTNRAWNAGTTCCGGVTIDDVTYLRHVVAAVAGRTPVDLRRVYVLGLSNGGMMALRAVCDAPDLFAAAGSVAGPYLGGRCGRPVWLHLHGGNDPIVPYAGGIPAGIPGLGVAYNWCRCSFPSTATEASRYPVFVGVSYARTGTHTWPSVGDRAWNLDANSRFWQFFTIFHH
jgi:poly(3-hydroxybutyrate) depolymerase